MTDTENIEVSAKTDEESVNPGPPAFEEMPEWFQKEITERNVARGVEVDSRNSHSQTFRKNILIFGACLNAAILWLVFDPTWGALFLLAAAGALTAYLCLRFEAEKPLGVGIAAVCNLPPYFAVIDASRLSGLDALPYFYTCLFLVGSGVVISQTVSNERHERLPF